MTGRMKVTTQPRENQNNLISTSEMLQDLYPKLNYFEYIKVLGYETVDKILDDWIEQEFDIQNPDPKFCYSVLDKKLDEFNLHLDKKKDFDTQIKKSNKKVHSSNQDKSNTRKKRLSKRIKNREDNSISSSDEEHEFCGDNNDKKKSKRSRRAICESDDEEN